VKYLSHKLSLSLRSVRLIPSHSGTKHLVWFTSRKCLRDPAANWEDIWRHYTYTAVRWPRLTRIARPFLLTSRLTVRIFPDKRTAERRHLGYFSGQSTLLVKRAFAVRQRTCFAGQITGLLIATCKSLQLGFLESQPPASLSTAFCAFGAGAGLDTSIFLGRFETSRPRDGCPNGAQPGRCTVCRWLSPRRSAK